MNHAGLGPAVEPPATPPMSPAPKQAPMEVTGAELRATGILLGFFLVCMAFAVLLAGPSLSAGLQQFDDPGDPVNVAWYIVLILAFTFLILWVAKRGWKWIIKLLILLAVGSSVFLIVLPLCTETLGMSANASGMLALVAAAAVTLGLWKHPEWYVIDIAGLIVAGGAAAIFGISFVPWLVVLLLALLAIYDAIAVYRTKHMLSLADTVIELRLPVLLVIPKHGGYRFREDTARMKAATQTNKKQREAMFMGLGDLVMPTILVVSAFVFLPQDLDFQADALEHQGDLVVDVRASPVDHGRTVDVTYVIAGNDPAAAWRIDYDADEDFDDEGLGLPATVTHTYDAIQGIHVNVNVTSAGQTGEATLPVRIQAPEGPWYQPVLLALQNGPALGAALGTLAGYFVLMGFVLRGNPQAGLPLLNGGAIAGFLVGLYLATGSLRFW